MSTTRLRFHCPHCQKPIRYGFRMAGRNIECPNMNCRGRLVLPSDTAVPPRPKLVTTDDDYSHMDEVHGVRRSSEGEGAGDSGVSVLLATIAGVWLTVLVLILIASCILPGSVIIAPAVAVPWFLIGLAGMLRVFRAKARVLTEPRKEVTIFFGLIKFVAWEPYEGVVLLRDKSVTHLDDNPFDGGGMKTLYPGVGDEVALRVSLERQPLEVIAKEVLTREFLALTVIRARIEWQIVNIKDFYLHVGQEIHGLTNRREHFDEIPLDRPKFEVAKHLLTLIAEERIRAVIAQAPTGLLVVSHVIADMPPDVRTRLVGSQTPQSAGGELVGPSSSADYRSATNALASKIQQALAPQMKQYGIAICQVALQEVVVPREILDVAKDACAKSYLPMKAQFDAAASKIEILSRGEAHAAARGMMLGAEAAVIGEKAVAAREVISAAPPLTLTDILNKVLADYAKTHRTQLSGPAKD